ncbi:bacteriohemerythrin [Anaeromicropila herbilytica]|uniref:Hemerythrin n=1 Tax=Anaeromicropila herbilytica TaxID=2785025 RepID=A0A7R7ENC8_9FIRM|nr:hemerythrin family protein [Anaeromicropila herbilytica]BCN31977.1 hemerythrin [Anaeromicropila herbilytica]
MFEMKEEYLTGITEVDDQHRELFRIAKEAYELLNQDFIADKYDHIVAIIEELRNYTKKHFADEEAYMESIGYKRMFTQKMEHNQFIEKLEEINLDDIDNNQVESLLKILEFLDYWLGHHILENDILIGK